jgi:hypothetical protein
MAALWNKPVLLCLTLSAAILSLCSVLSTAELQQFEQDPKADRSLSFLVVGDWGRRGGFNQSEVAEQVSIISTFLLYFSSLHTISCMAYHSYISQLLFHFYFILFISTEFKQ